MVRSKVRIGLFSDFAINPNRRARPTDYPINDAKSLYLFLKTILRVPISWCDDGADPVCSCRAGLAIQVEEPA
jgi:hypothetical protein